MIPIAKPYFGEEERLAVQQPLETGWVVQGPHVERFERLFTDYTGAPHAVATSSCTTALHVAVEALGIERGDEVVVPAFTWVSTANIVELSGGRPVFCDVDLATFNASPAAIEGAVSDRTVGMIPVHLFGLCAELGPVLQLARERGLWVVEDAACALGSYVDGAHAGTLGDAGCFSFHARKLITTGEGGMITTARDDLAGLSRSLRDHGASRSDFQRHSDGSLLLSEHDIVGFNVRLTDIQGALGCAQMERVEWIVERRQALAARYDEALAGVEWLRTPAVPEGYVHSYQAYVCLFAPEEPTLENVDELHRMRNRLMDDLHERGISTRQGTHAAVLQNVYARKYDLRPEQFPNAYVADRLTLALPLYPQLTEAEQETVIDALAQGWRAIAA
ncbi:MAG: DegT/DnrJ/EryC1/StrS family aminotransferase [Actinomycetota bacterium]|nr:DegT/DnrJ/EryC1/StrS family aminotransferase [Actinomycetota bacterium]